MVMETPSPQSIGREFVRQYYTILSQAPLHLHRFYSSSSSFVHGGIDLPGKETKPIFGQQEIHKRIMQLNFRDCHAKIHQVDSHATLGNGVVVQVSGELSNNGGTMQRFMQTFVLAPQSPKQYYVHNDIFRYLYECVDEEEEVDTQETRQEVESDHGRHEEAMNRVNSLQDNEPNYYQQASQPLSNGSVHLEESQSIMQVGSVNLTSQVIPPATPPQVQTAPPLAVSPLTPPAQTSMGPASVSGMSIGAESDDSQSEVSQPALAVESISYEKLNIQDDQEAPEEEEELQESSGLFHSDEPKTYANMVSKNPGSSAFSSVTSATLGGASGGTTGNVREPSVTSQTKERPERIPSESSTTWNSVPQQQRPARTPRASGPRQGFGAGPGDRMSSGRGDRRSEDGGMSFNSGGYNSGGSGFGGSNFPEGERRRNPVSTYPDNQQVFVGNLPLDVGEEELKEFFANYGTVVDLRINSKPGIKSASGVRVPNFGFVVFDDPMVVQKILSEKPIMFGDQRLNVEEKKPKPRDPTRMGSGGDGRPMGGRGGFSVGGPGRGAGAGSFRGGRGGGGGDRAGGMDGGGGRGGMSNRPNGGGFGTYASGPRR